MADVRPIADMRVLLADDNRDAVDALGELIQIEFGCSVAIAYDGRQALALARSSPHDVLVLDLQMPGLSGLEVAEALADELAAQAAQADADHPPPLLLAMTGRSDVASDLAAIDTRFARAFAKPIDYATLFDTLRAHWLGARPRKNATPFQFLETYTRAARDVLPLMAARHQQLSFDGEGPELTLAGDEVSLHSAIYRLMCGGLDLTGEGIVLFAARSTVDEDGGHTLAIHVAGSGRLEASAHHAGVLQRLGLGVDPGANGFIQASGVCPNSGGRVHFAYQPSEGVLLRLELAVQPVDVEPAPVADGSRAWIVDGRDVAPAVLERRLQRLGWHVWRFASAADAARQLDAAGDAGCPELLVMREDSLVSRAARLALADRMPERTRCLLLVGAGAAVLRDPAALPGCEIRVEPLSPGDLAALTARASNDRAHTVPMTTLHTLRGRRKVLVVDDHEVNRFVACGLLQALGYEVAAVGDGLDAIEHCKLTPPDAVLMDINMPVLDGIDASRRILELQKLGRVAPFPIVAATADDAPETKARCLVAGLAGYLCKPLRLESIRDELRRVGVPATADAAA